MVVLFTVARWRRSGAAGVTVRGLRGGGAVHELAVSGANFVRNERKMQGAREVRQHAEPRDAGSQYPEREDARRGRASGATRTRHRSGPSQTRIFRARNQRPVSSSMRRAARLTACLENGARGARQAIDELGRQIDGLAIPVDARLKCDELGRIEP